MPVEGMPEVGCHDTPDRHQFTRRECEFRRNCAQDAVANQHEEGQDKKWTDRKMTASEKDIANHVIIVRRDHTFPGGTD